MCEGVIAAQVLGLLVSHSQITTREALIRKFDVSIQVFNYKAYEVSFLD